MRFLHLGDIHLGKVVNGFSMLQDQRVALMRLLDDAEEHDVDALVLAGDLYDSGQPSGAAVRVMSDFLTEAFGRGFEIFAIPGNHDSAERVGYTTELLSRQGVHISGPFTGELSPIVVEDEYGRVNLWLVPFVRPIDVRLAFGDSSIGTSVTRAFQAIVERMAVDPRERNVLVAHQFVTAGSSEPERCDSETIWVGGADNVDASVFEPFDYVALGHIHRPQSMGKDTIRYAGSLLKYSLSEVHHHKSAVLVDLGPKGELSYELLPIRPLHDLREIKGPFAELIAKDVVAAGDAQDYFHVILTDDVVPLHAFQRLREYYPRVMAMDVENASTKASPDLSHMAVDIAAMDPLGLFCQFFKEQNNRDLSAEEMKTVEEALEQAFGATSSLESR